MKVCYEGEELEFDLERVTVRQAMQLKMKLGLTLLGLDEGLTKGDPDALLAVYWLMRTHSSDKPVDIDTLDFKIVKLANAIQEAVEKEQAEQEEEVKAAGKAPKKREGATTIT